MPRELLLRQCFEAVQIGEECLGVRRRGAATHHIAHDRAFVFRDSALALQETFEP